MKYITKICLFYFISINILYSQTSPAKININDKGVFVDAPCTPGGSGMRKTGILTFDNGNKIIGSWLNDTLHGLAKKIYKDGVIEQGKWQKGILKEKYDSIEFYNDGCVKLSFNNKINGKSRNYFNNGELISEEIYENGKKIKRTEFNDNYENGIGKIKKEVVYDGDYATYINYSEKGKLSTAKSIKTSLNQGWETFHNNNGILISRSLYEMGKRISSETYFENGTLESFEDTKVYWSVNKKGEKTRFINKTTKIGFIFFDRPNDNKELHKWEGEIDIDFHRPNGKGKLYLLNGDKFIGSYVFTNISNSEEGDFEGAGEYFFKEGDVYRGNFRNGRFEGAGEIFYKNGNTYRGNFKNSLRDGYGKLSNRNGKISEGEWENGNLINVPQKVVSNSNKTVKNNNKNKKPKLPDGFYSWSTSEMTKWYDSEEGMRYLNSSGLLTGVLTGLLKEGMETSNTSRSDVSSSSSSSLKKVFICSNTDGCCLAVVNSKYRPSEGICKNRKHLSAVQIGHSWSEVGKQGNKSFICNRCSVVVNTSSSPKGGGCCSVGGCSSGHSWSEVK